MIADLIKVVDEGEIVVYDIRFIDELRVFVYNSQGKPGAEKGEHDDCVIDLAGLVQLHQRCPWNEDFSWADDKVKAVSQANIMGGFEVDDDDDPDELMYESMDDYE